MKKKPKKRINGENVKCRKCDNEYEDGVCTDCYNKTLEWISDNLGNIANRKERNPVLVFKNDKKDGEK